MADISQKVAFSSSPKEVYSLLTNEKEFSQLTSAAAKIDATKGGKFSVWGDYATGKFIKLQPDTEIIQTWRASDWPDGAESTVSFQLVPNKEGCVLHFHQTGVPEDFAQDIKQGWEDYYWNLMKKYLKEH